MKKLIALLLALVLVMGLVACGNTTAPETTPAATTEAATEATEEVTEATEEILDTTPAAEPNEATKIYTAIWEKVPEANRFFGMGGDMTAMVDGAPGNYALEDEGVSTVLLIPADQIANITEISSLMHGMMANHYTGSIVKMAEGADVAAYTAAMKEAIGSAQWICGMPEKSLIAVIDGQYVLAAFGLNDNIVSFENALAEAYPDAEIVSNDAITG
ncbi:MAG: hypothetical protein IKU07_00305 [Oscillospiraceae bacterium]|nr:hypothetical protein [Oscillospiraceae bacterium]